MRRLLVIRCHLRAWHSLCNRVFALPRLFARRYAAEQVRRTRFVIMSETSKAVTKEFVSGFTRWRDVGLPVRFGQGAIIHRRIVKFLGYNPHPTPRTVGDRLRKIRRCHGLTSRQAAWLADVHQESFLEWERGLWTPTILTRARLDQFLECFEHGLPADHAAVDD
jgi:DNA-binding XRE family transcriptional regulator